MVWLLFSGAMTRLCTTSSEPVSCLPTSPSNQRKGKQRVGIFARFGEKMSRIGIRSMAEGDKAAQGRIQGGGGVLGVRTPPPLFGRPLNLIKREKNFAHMHAKRHILKLDSYQDPPPHPFRNPVSTPAAGLENTLLAKACRTRPCVGSVHPGGG